MTIRELINLLNSLPEESKDLVACAEVPTDYGTSSENSEVEGIFESELIIWEDYRPNIGFKKLKCIVISESGENDPYLSDRIK